jgi:tetratricopeptide (TPR) repeat protein
MTLVSRLMMGAALSLGAISLVGSPVAAQKKKDEKAAAASGFKLSKEFRTAVAPAQAAVKAGDFPGATATLAAAEAVAVTPDEKYVISAVRLELGTASKDSKIQAQAVDGMIASGSAPATDLPRLHFFAGNFAYQAQDYTAAAAKLSEVERLGYKGTDMYLLLAESHFKLNQVPQGLPFVDKAIAESTAAGQKAPESWYARASSVAYKAKLSAEVGKWTRMQVKAYPTAENWRSALVIYRDSAKLEGQLALDLMRLMRVTKSLAGERDFFEYASLATERALPGEAKSAIEEGYASGSVARTSRAVSEMLTLANGKIAADKASLASSEKQASSSANGRAASGTADAYLAYGEYDRAIGLYRLALQKGGIDVDQVNTRLGIALARSGKAADARAVFANVNGPRAEIARFWTLWLDTTAAPVTPAA